MEISFVFPEDLMIKILSWLPVKSLIRFKSVSKSWRSLIETPSFITKHLNNDRDTGCLYFNRHDIDSNDYLHSLVSNDTLEVIADFDLPYLYDDRDVVSICIVGICDGIICLYDCCDVGGAILWNPAIRELKILPELNVPRPIEMIRCCPIAFGFDVKLNQYKVIYLVETHNPNESFCQIEVFDLCADSWRKSNAVMPSATIISHGWPCPAPYIGGYFSWLAEDKCDRFMIFSFEFSQEVLTATPLPDNCEISNRQTGDSTVILTVLHGFVALINHRGSNMEMNSNTDMLTRVWMLKEYGVKDSWTKLYTVGPLLGLRRPLAFWKNKDLLVETTGGRLALFNFDTLDMKILPYNRLGSTGVFLYKYNDPRIPRKLPPHLTFLTYTRERMNYFREHYNY